MFNPQIWLALAIAFLAWGGVQFGVGYHYGEKNTVPVKTYQALDKKYAEDEATIKTSKDKHDSDAKALAASALDLEKKRAQHKTDLATDDARVRAALAKRNLDDVTLATTRRVLDAVAAENAIRAKAGTPVASADNGATQPTDIAGRLDTCKSTLTATVGSSAVNDSELKRSIIDRDDCVARYHSVEHQLNGD
jgi:hypothetical protein